MNKVVTSVTNPGVKRVVKLRSARARREEGLFIIEGFREVRRALEGDIAINELWVCPELWLGSHEDEIVEGAEARGAEVIEASREPFEKMAYRDRPEGLLAVANFFDTTITTIRPSDDALILVVESIEKPGNLGTMIRAAGAAGVEAVIVCDPATDVFNPNVVRSSIGTCFVVPVGVGTTDEALAWLRKHGVSVVASTPDATTPIWDAPLTGKTALVVGSEQYGLSDVWLDAADHKVQIPMPGEIVDSLNASASAAIALYEAVRQRHRST